MCAENYKTRRKWDVVAEASYTPSGRRNPIFNNTYARKEDQPGEQTGYMLPSDELEQKSEKPPDSAVLRSARFVQGSSTATIEQQTAMSEFADR